MSGAWIIKFSRLREAEAKAKFLEQTVLLFSIAPNCDLVQKTVTVNKDRDSLSMCEPV